MKGNKLHRFEGALCRMVRANKLPARVLVGGCMAVIASAIVLAVAGQGPRARIDVRVGVAPTPFSGSDGQIHLAYELIVAGVSGTNGARFERAEVFGESDPKPLISYASSDLDQRVMRPEADPKVRYGRLVPSGTTALIHVWITLAKDKAVPRTLRHSFGISAEDDSTVAVGEARVDVHSATPLVVGSPFRAGAWLAHNGPGQHRSPHWGSALVNERGARIPQRYAIDFMGSMTKEARFEEIFGSPQTRIGSDSDTRSLPSSMASCTQHGMASLTTNRWSSHLARRRLLQPTLTGTT